MWSTTRARLEALPVLVTLAQLQAARIDADVARRASLAGDWVPVLPGAWLRHPVPVTRRHRQEAALALVGSSAALTGADACALHQLRDVPDDPLVSLLVPAGCRRRLGPYVRLVATAADVEVLNLQGLRVVEPGRAGLCRRAIDAAAAGCRSAPEAEAADAVREAVRRGVLPPYDLNAELLLDGTSLGSPDGWLDGLGLGWEVDSYRHHGSVEDLDATLLRHERYERAGLELLHITPARFRKSPRAFVDELCARAEQRRSLAQPEPPGLVVVRRASVQLLRERAPLIVGTSRLEVRRRAAPICG